MRTYALKRLLISVPLVFVMTFVVFVVINWSGSSKFDTFENDPAADPQIVEQEKRRLGIYDPIPVRYAHWLQGVLFDLRFAAERRFVATFEDNDPDRGDDKYRFGGTEIREALAGAGGADYGVGGEKGAPVLGLESRDVIKSGLDIRTWEALVFKASSPVPKGLALIVETEDGRQIPFNFAVKPDGGSLTVDLIGLNKQAAIENIVAVSLDSAEKGTAHVSAERIRRRIWQETLPGREKKRLIQVTYAGREGQYAELGAFKSPYTTKPPDGSDWDPDWIKIAEQANEAWKLERAQWEKGDRSSPEPERRHVIPVRFDALELESRAIEGDGLKVQVQLLCGNVGEAKPYRLGEFSPGVKTSLFTLPLSGLVAGADIHSVRGIRLVSSGKGRIEFDDFRLRAGGSGFHVGAPNFGQSWDKKKDVVSLIAEKVSNTILLNVLALVFTWLIALPIGIYSAVRQYSPADRAISFLSFVGMAMPSFFLATLIVFVVALTYEIPATSAFHFLNGILPIAGRTSPDHSTMSYPKAVLDVARHMILPVLVGVLGGIGGLQRVLRGTMLEERRKLYVTTAMAKGLPGRTVLFKHALRNAIIPFVASIGSLLPGLIGGSAFVEIVFDYPGIGRQMLESVQSYDIPVVMANTLIVGLLLVIGNLLADILLGMVDPRISVEG